MAGERVLDGAQIYGPEVSDTNPPLAIWFSMLPVMLSRVVPISYTMSLRVISVLLLVGATGWCIRILGRTQGRIRSAALAVTTLVLLVAGTRLAPRDFGQREHLFVLLSLPCLFAAAAETRAVRADELPLLERCAIGVAAGIAICFKPQYALAFLAAELVMTFYHRSLREIVRAESLASIATCAVYFAAIRTLTPLYTHKMLPLLLDTYWAYGNLSVMRLLLTMKLWILAAVVLSGASFFLSRPFSRLVEVFAAGSIGAAVGCAVQRTDWPYHWFPAKAFVIVAAGLFGVGLVQGWDSLEETKVSKPMMVAGMIVAIAAATLLGVRRAMAPPPDRTQVYRFLKKQSDLRSAYIFTTALNTMSDVMDLKLRWGARSPCLWLIPAIVQNEQGSITDRPFKRLTEGRLLSLSEVQRNEVADDLDHFQPSLVLVEHCDDRHVCQAIEGKSFDAIPWFLEGERFRRAWSHYRRIASESGELAMFDVYERIT